MPLPSFLLNGPVLVILVSLVAAALLYTVAMLLARHAIPDTILSAAMVKQCMRSIRGPVAALVGLLSLRTAIPALMLPQGTGALVRQTSAILFICATGWLCISLIKTARDMVTGSFDVSASDNLRARKIHTQTRVAEQILISLVFVIGTAMILMTFDQIRHLGTSLLASAGVMGIILGFAAQKSIATLVAGVQIAITQPIRVDDVVIVEGEWGWIEEITLTYVVVKIWDLRRLVLPVTWFLERPFQNWTRVSADILGTVFVYADYTVPLEPLRSELQRICAASPLWDGKVCGMQVTDATATTVEIRALVSALDSPKAWDLRCLVREKLISFLQEHYPQALPRTRVSLQRNKNDLSGSPPDA